MLSSLPPLDLFLWAVTTLLGLSLFCFILARHLDRQFSFLTLYLGVNLLQTVAQLFVYQFYGFYSNVTFIVAWGSQALVVVARALAAREFCYRVLGHYTGVWTLASRILLICGVIVLTLTLLFSHDGFRYAVMALEIAVEAFIATIVVGMVLFARHYEAPMDASSVLLGLGFGLNSCMKILNDAVVSRYWKNYLGVWNEVAMVAFAGVLVLWIFAMRAAKVYVTKPELQAANIYSTLVPQMNRRLAELNDRLTHFFKAEQPRR